MSHGASAADIRKQIGHPIIDADGHWLEFGPVVVDYLRRVGGESVVRGFGVFSGFVRHNLSLTVEERKARRIGLQAWWALPTRNTRDRATAMMPRLLYERLPELGIDFAVLYPTGALGVPFIPDDEIRAASCRAFNQYVADLFRDYSDRITPAAVIPMHTPEEAIAELRHVKELGLKVVMMSSLIRRPIPALAAEGVQGRHAVWHDVLGIDSDYDYDPVWAACEQLGFSPTFHSGSRSMGLRNSPTNFTYNHIGHFAAAGEAVCKALFIGGVTRRFPRVKFAFLEGGVGWAAMLYADLIGHWQKRNLNALEEVNPKNLKRELLIELAQKYAGDAFAQALARPNGSLGADGSDAATGGIKQLDDFAACGIERAEDIRDLFVPSFYFGCEADDRMNALAFNRQINPFGARLNALFGSDIGHFDVPDMAGVVPEAYELVEDGLITEDDFREFVLANPVRFWGESNPGFFRGTAVEREAAALLGAARTQREPRAPSD
jgi:predicted TIM-barrel fold metal-dependent hydrolase